MPRRVDRTGVRELTHLHISAAVAQHFDALGSRAWVTRAIHHQIGAEAANDVAHFLDACFRGLEPFDVDGCFRAELACQFEPRLFRRADAYHASCTHLLRRRDRQYPDGARALDQDGIAPGKAAGVSGTVEGADA